MEITIKEAGEALSVCNYTIVRWYLSSYTASAPRHYTVDSEALCSIIGLDHRFLMAWLTGYDVALTASQVCKLLRKNPRWLERPREVKPVVSYHTSAKTRVGKASFMRWSQRQVGASMPIMQERKRNAKNLFIFGGTGLGPSPDQLDPKDRRLQFTSSLETLGRKLPSTFWLRNKSPLPESTLLNGYNSMLPRYWSDLDLI